MVTFEQEVKSRNTHLYPYSRIKLSLDRRGFTFQGRFSLDKDEWRSAVEQIRQSWPRPKVCWVQTYSDRQILRGRIVEPGQICWREKMGWPLRAGWRVGIVAVLTPPRMTEDEHIELYHQDISNDHFGKLLIISYKIFRHLIDLIFA